MIELYNVTDYGRYLFNHEAETGKDNQGIDFGELMMGSDGMSDKSDNVPVRLHRMIDFNLGTFIDMVTYNHSGTKQMLSLNLGTTIDITM